MKRISMHPSRAPITQSSSSPRAALRQQQSTSARTSSQRRSSASTDGVQYGVDVMALNAPRRQLASAEHVMLDATFTTLSGGSWYSFMNMMASTPLWELVALQSPYCLCPPTHTYAHLATTYAPMNGTLLKKKEKPKAACLMYSRLRVYNACSHGDVQCVRKKKNAVCRS